MQAVKVEDIKTYIGKELPASKWHTINQETINLFADVTEDKQSIHVNVEEAKKTPFGGTIAHGFLTLSLISKMAKDFSIPIEGATMGINYGFDKIRFLTPVPSGASVRAIANIVDVQKKTDKHILTKYNISIEIQGVPSPAIICEWLLMSVLT